MIQWCMKGLSLDDDVAACRIITERRGLVCNWWRAVGTISPAEIAARLTPDNIAMHVNQFKATDPATGRPFNELSPFVSLSAGTIERDAVMKTNRARRALDTALWFGSDFGRKQFAYVYRCWLIVAPRPSVEVSGVAEEVRDLNAYQRWSPYQTQGEITAKIEVRANQIQQCEKWDVSGVPRRLWVEPNPWFTSPETLSNVRELI